MKKAKRFLTGLLSAVMALSLCAMPAMADEATKTPVPTIDTTAEGSLTIYKYEGNEQDESKLLGGVTFTAYQIATIEQKPTTDGVIDVTLEPVEALTAVNENIKITRDTTYDNIKGDIKRALENEDESKRLKAFGTATTDTKEPNKGIAKFVKMPVGVYLIVETDAPSQIVNKSANFLISIPMVNSDGTDWNYDITVYPKNEAIYGGVNLHKYGKIGQDGEENNLPNATFYLQKKNSDDEWETVLNPKVTANQGTLGDNGLLTTNGSGIINITGLAPGEYRFIEVDAPDGYIADGVTAYYFKIDEEGNPVIDDHKDTADNTIKVVNEKPDLDKTVKDRTAKDKDDNDVYKTDADYSVGDSIPWKLTVKVPSNVDKLKTFEITDNMSAQLTWEKDKANVTVTTDPDVELTSPEDYTISEPIDGTAGGELKITFTPDGKKKMADAKTKTIEITFNATLNNTAKVGVEGNLNDAKLTYSNGFYPTEDPENPNNNKQPKEDKITDQAIVYTFGLSVLKIDGDSKEPLSNAEFDLYLYSGTDENPTLDELKTNGTKINETPLKSNEKGEIVVDGLKKGTYYLVETKAPVDANGKSYNLLKAPIKVEITPTYETTTTTTVTTNEDGVTTTETTITTKKINGQTEGNGTYSVTVANRKGFDLPVTGGFGTLLFSGIGVLLVVAGVGVLLSLKKKNRA